MVMFDAVAMQANVIQPNYSETMVTFDTNSEPMGVKNRFTGCISNRIEDFEGPMFKSDRSKKIGSSTAGIIIGTLAWKWMDYDRKEHTLLISESFNIKVENARLLSTQHWSKTQKYGKPTQGTGSETDARKVTLLWNQKENKLTIPVVNSNNVATFLSAPG